MRIGSNSTAIGFAALLAVSHAGAQDVAAFWRSTLARLAAEPVDAVEKELHESLPYKTYGVEYRSLGGVRVRARLAIPIRGGEPAQPLPAIVTVPGYGGTQQGIMLAECQRGYAILQVYPRSQGPSAELWKIDSGEKLTWRLSKPDGAYYQLAYADVIRGVDYLAERAGIDPNRIGIAGTSQGGGIALAVASLDPRLKAVAAHVPFLCDMRQAARIEGSLVKTLLDKAGMNDEAHLETLAYFDPLSLAPSLRAPALVSSGGRDTVCPAATIRAVFDRIPSTKSLLHEPDLPHTTSALFYRLTWHWLDQYLRP
ncbi:MAG: acetylxylan esterase [Bryobacterales bacterium]|nr:acetylxylan esterase [Bryobacterales bacterium]